MSAPLPAPRRHTTAQIIFAVCVVTAPLFWFAQLLLGYGTWSYGCYPGDHPVRTDVSHGIYTLIIAFDVISILAAAGAGIFSLGLWRSVGDKMKSEPPPTISTVEKRTRFMAVWGVLFSGCFLVAILFSTISSLMAPPCG
jgi:hypothetical protein